MTAAAATPRAFDLVAIGSGPAGQEAAVQAAALGKRVAVIEQSGALGGVSTNTGTVPSKTLRAAVVELTGGGGGVYGGSFSGRHEIAIDDLVWRTRGVIEHEQEAVARRLRRNGVTVIEGEASFLDAHVLAVDSGERRQLLHAHHVVVAVGTTPGRPADVEFDDRTVLDSDGILKLGELPRSLAVIGGGIVGLEYASMAAALGIHVTVVEQRPRILDFVDEELVEELQYHLQGHGLTFRLGDEAVAVRRTGEREVTTQLASGDTVRSQAVLHTAGRRGATDALNLAAAGLEPDGRGRIAVGAQLRTQQPHIFAVGDVVGSTMLAAAAIEQGRIAALAAFGNAPVSPMRLLPCGIHTIPEVSFVGPTERSLASAGTAYVAGRAYFRDLSRAEIAGERSGLLKLLVDARTRRILGVHIFGTSATELVHLGQAFMAGRLSVDDVADLVFNVPTFSDAYTLAALDAIGRLPAERQARRVA